jgi:hypothetical protein
MRAVVNAGQVIVTSGIPPGVMRAVVNAWVG